MSYTKTRTISVSKQNVFFDIDMLSLSYSMREDDPVKGDHIATETASNNGRRIITRMCDSRAADIRQTIQRFLAPDTVALTADDDMRSDDYIFPLLMTVEMEDNTLSTIADLAHKYIVSGALADYYAQIGVQGNRESLQLRANEALSRIRELIYYRPMP